MDFSAQQTALQQALYTPIKGIVDCSEKLVTKLCVAEEVAAVLFLTKINQASQQLLERMHQYLAQNLNPTVKQVGVDQVRHDLRSPLTVVIGYSELLLEEIDSQWHNELDHIQLLSRQLLAVIDQIVLEGDELTLQIPMAICALPVEIQKSYTNTLRTESDFAGR